MGCRKIIQLFSKLKCWVWLFLSCRISFKKKTTKYLYGSFSDQSLHSAWHQGKPGRESEGVFGLFIKPRLKKKLLRSESCFPFHTMLYFYFSFLFFLTNWLWRLSWPPQWDLTPTLRWQLGGGSRSGPLLPLRLLFWTGCGEKNSHACVEDFKDRGPGHKTGPHPPLHPLAPPSS